MKIVVVTNGNFFARIILERLLRERARDVAGIMVITGVKVGKSRLASLFEIASRSGMAYFLYKASTYVIFAVASLLYRRRSFFVPGLAAELGIPVRYASQVNDPSVVAQVQAWAPDVLVSVSCPQIIRAELLRVPSRMAINIHSSLLPRYAGLAPYLWVLANGEEKTGTTVHLMDEKLDTGPILVQKELEIRERESLFALFLRLSSLGADAMAEAVDAIDRGDFELREQNAEDRDYYSWPTRTSVRAMRRNGHPLASASDFVEAMSHV